MAAESFRRKRSRTKRFFRKLIPCILILLLSVPFTASAEEEFPYDPIYETSGYYEYPAETEEEQKIYSFVQTTWQYYPDLRWTGPWSYIEAGGQKFFYFGCGVCCLTNIYDTLTENVVSPTQMYRWCLEYSDYNPNSGKGAMSWAQLAKMCDHLGLEATLHKKPSSFNAFCEDVANSRVTLVLVCKTKNSTLWDYTKGHYVTLWEYDEASQGVFVADPSGLHNRHRESLSEIYKVLKTGSQYQYMTINLKN